MWLVDAVRSNAALRILLMLMVVYIVLCILLALPRVAGSLMFFPPEATYTSTTANILDRRPSVESRFVALWLENPKAGKAIIYFHGNAEDIGESYEAMLLHGAGYSVLVPEYPGYGIMPGVPTERGVYAVADEAYRFLTEAIGMDPKDIVLFGRSIGSGPACYLAQKYADVGGIVLYSGFTSPYRTVTRVRIMPADPFPNLSRIGSIACPKLFIHGTHDSVVPYAHAVKMHAKADGRKRLVSVEQAGHDDMLSYLGSERLKQLVGDFGYGRLAGE